MTINIGRAVTHPLMPNPTNYLGAFPGEYSKIAAHRFLVAAANNPYVPFAVIQFQDGPIKEDHIDGVLNEDLLLMVLDRLKYFNSTKFACEENSHAIQHIEEALMWLVYRTKKRDARGVEGTNIV